MVQLKRNEHGFLEVFPRPTSDELLIHYQERYFQESRSTYREQYSDSERALFYKRIELSIGAASIQISNLKGLAVLDLGCGEGWATSYFASKGAHVTGVDFSNDGLKRHNPDLISQFRQADIYKFLESEDSTYDIVWTDHLLEHVIEPIRLMELVKSRLKAGGKFFVKVPNDGSQFQKELLDSGIVEAQWWVAPPEHLSYFTLDSLQNLGIATGLAVESKLASFPIDWFIPNSASNYVANPDLGRPAHHARLFIETFITSQPLERQIDFYSALAGLGLGRDITVVFSKE